MIAKMMSVRTKQKFLTALLILGTLLPIGCRSKSTANVPSDLLFIMDVKSARDIERCAVHVNIKIFSSGEGRYELYDTDCAIEFDSNHMVTYKRSQVLETGSFQLTDTELEQLWIVINENNFFNLTDDYRMSIGFSYAFIMVQAEGQQHIVDNIGMEVSEVRAIVEATDALMPEDVKLEYGEGFVP